VVMDAPEGFELLMTLKCSEIDGPVLHIERGSFKP
jgi:hypothetical protein